MVLILDQSYIESNQDSDYGVANTLQKRLGMQISPSANGDFSQVKLYLSKKGNGGDGSINAEIWTDSANLPGAQIGANSNSIVCSTLSLLPTYTLYTFNFSRIHYSKSNKYWIVLDDSSTPSTTDNIRWGCDSSSPSYAGGNLAYQNTDDSWHASANEDFIFYEYYQKSTGGIFLFNFC